MSYPAEFKNCEEWEKTLDKMIWAFEHVINEETCYEEFNFEKIKEDGEREQKGLELFGKYFNGLWV
jgi:hypothetical protein